MREREQVSDGSQPQEGVSNPLFRLEKRPYVTETLLKDVIRVFTGESDVNIKESRVEDYLDDTRRLLSSENTSFEVKVAHDLLDVHDYEEVSLRARVEHEKQVRNGTLIRELLQDEKTSQSTEKVRYKFSENYQLLTGSA